MITLISRSCRKLSMSALQSRNGSMSKCRNRTNFHDTWTPSLLWIKSIERRRLQLVIAGTDIGRIWRDSATRSSTSQSRKWSFLKKKRKRNPNQMHPNQNQKHPNQKRKHPKKEQQRIQLRLLQKPKRRKLQSIWNSIDMCT